jgi:hypothetical protein
MAGFFLYFLNEIQGKIFLASTRTNNLLFMGLQGYVTFYISGVTFISGGLVNKRDRIESKKECRLSLIGCFSFLGGVLV